MEETLLCCGVMVQTWGHLRIILVGATCRMLNSYSVSGCGSRVTPASWFSQFESAVAVTWHTHFSAN